MKAIRVELTLIDNENTEHFITQVLPKLKEEYKMKQVVYSNMQYFEKE